MVLTEYMNATGGQTDINRPTVPLPKVTASC